VPIALIWTETSLNMYQGASMIQQTNHKRQAKKVYNLQSLCVG